MGVLNYIIISIIVALFLLLGYLYDWIFSGILFIILLILGFIEYGILIMFDRFKINRARRKHEETKRTGRANNTRTRFNWFRGNRTGEIEGEELEPRNDFVGERPRADEPISIRRFENLEPKNDKLGREYREDKEGIESDRYTPI